jgi:hypothetical protein
MRDEAAQEMADSGPAVADARFLDCMEEMWQEVHAAELPYERLHEDYYTGFSSMILRATNVWLDELRVRSGKAMSPQEAWAIQVARNKVADAIKEVEKDQ